MYNIIRYIRQNSMKILGIVLFVVFIYSMIITANTTYENQGRTTKNEQQEINEINNENLTQKTDTIKLNDKICKDTIRKFLNHCMYSQTKEAYTYLSKDCKKNKYSTLEQFENIFCVPKENENLSYSIEKASNISKYSYQVEFNNKLATGRTNSKRNIEIYTIVVENENEIKISIE